MIDYPSDEELERIKTWPFDDMAGLVEYVRERWWPDGHYGWKREGRHLYISTGGWSGNEDVIHALTCNAVFWAMCWQQSKRGGHYQFRLPEKVAEALDAPEPPQDRRSPSTEDTNHE